jgi:hypothetical protein
MVLTEQIPLIQIVDSDDEILSQDKNINQWYHVLKDFPWRPYRNLAAAYYDALYAFNLSQKEKEKEKHNAIDSTHDEDETKEHARQRLLFERATLDPNAAILYAAPSAPSTVSTVDPLFLAPGIVPDRLVGKKPKCFFALFKAFLGAALMGFAAEPEYVHKLLISNLSFARSCGFVPKTVDAHYWHRHVPSLRKLEQFDQIMTQYNLWSRQKWEEVRQNIESGVVQHLETELVGDTTHYYAYSSFETVTYLDENGCLLKKSQSKVTKRCSCEDKNECSHPWEQGR